MIIRRWSGYKIIFLVYNLKIIEYDMFYYINFWLNIFNLILISIEIASSHLFTKYIFILLEFINEIIYWLQIF
jgi:hypothetical protein